MLFFLSLSLFLYHIINMRHKKGRPEFDFEIVLLCLLKSSPNDRKL